MNNPIESINQNGYFHVFFCESIRAEVDNKHTFVGIYPNELKVESFPYVLPQLSLAATLVIPRVQVSGEDIFLRILIDDRVIGAVDLSPEVNSTNAEQNDNILEISNLVINGGPLKIEEPCTIKARVDIADASIF